MNLAVRDIRHSLGRFVLTTIGVGMLLMIVMGTGTLEARVKATINPKISGRVASVLVDQGDRVSEREVLVRLDDEELRHQVEIATVIVAAAEAGLQRLKADRDRALGVMQQADFDYNRMKGLYEKDTAASVEFQKATEAMGIALIEHGMAKGPALALLLAGPALSLPNILVLIKVMDAKKAAAFRAIIVVVATTVGMIYGAVQPGYLRIVAQSGGIQ